MKVNTARWVFASDATTFVNYRFFPAQVFGTGRIASRDIDDIDRPVTWDSSHDGVRSGIACCGATATPCERPPSCK
jgi:hypothetical protein